MNNAKISGKVVREASVQHADSKGKDPVVDVYLVCCRRVRRLV